MVVKPLKVPYETLVMGDADLDRLKGHEKGEAHYELAWQFYNKRDYDNAYKHCIEAKKYLPYCATTKYDNEKLIGILESLDHEKMKRELNHPTTLKHRHRQNENHIPLGNEPESEEEKYFPDSEPEKAFVQPRSCQSDETDPKKLQESALQSKIRGKYDKAKSDLERALRFCSDDDKLKMELLQDMQDVLQAQNRSKMYADMLFKRENKKNSPKF